MITHEQAQADLDFWCACAEYADKCVRTVVTQHEDPLTGEAYTVGEECTGGRWQVSGLGLGDVSYGELIRGAMLTMREHETDEAMRVAGAVEQALQNIRRRMLLYQAREKRGVA